MLSAMVTTGVMSFAYKHHTLNTSCALYYLGVAVMVWNIDLPQSDSNFPFLGI